MYMSRVYVTQSCRLTAD